MNIAIKQRKDKKYENYTDLYLQAQELQKKGSKMEKEVKKGENSPAPPLARAKKEFIALKIKTKI